MSKIFDKLYIASTGSEGNSLSIYTSTASSNLISINSATSSYDVLKIRSYADSLTYTRDIVTTYAGTGNITFNGEGVYRTNFNLNNPICITFDNSGNMHISHNFRISKIDKNTGLVTTIAGTSTQGTFSNCLASEATFNAPRSVVFDNNNNFFVLDINDSGLTPGGRWWRILKYTATASYISQIAFSQSAQQSGYTMAIDTNTNDLYLAFYAGTKILKLTAPTYSQVTTITTDYAFLYGIDFVTSSNTIYYSTTANLVKKVIGGVTTTIVGNGSTMSIDGVAATASGTYLPSGVKFYNNNLYIVDRGNNRIRKVDSDGIITTIAGYTFSNGFYGEGISPLYAKFNTPYDIAFYDNEIYIADTANHRIRKVTINTNPYTRTSDATASNLYYQHMHG